MKEFTERRDERGDLQECDACGSAVPLIDYPVTAFTPRHGDTNDPNEHLCRFCYETFLGNILRYGGLYDRGILTLAQGLCQALNIVLRELKR